MSHIETRTIPTGSVEDLNALRMEINATATVGATCGGIRLTPDVAPAVSDELYMAFDVAPNDVVLDAVIAATPQTQPTLPPSLAVVKNAWQSLVSFAVPEGTTVPFSMVLEGHFGSGPTIQAISSRCLGACERPTGAGAQVERPFVYSANSRIRVRARASGNVVTLEIRPTTSGTLTIDLDRSALQLNGENS